MTKLVKMDLYRMVRTKSFYVVLIISAVYAVVLSILNSLNYENFQIVLQFKSKELGSFMSDCITNGSMINMMLISIFVAIFIAAEYKNGFIKNYVGRFPNKVSFVISKFISVMFIVLFIMTASLAFGILTQVLSGGLYLVSFVSIAKLLFTQFLLHVAFASLIYFVCMLTGSSALGMVLGILLSTGFINILYSGINFLFENVLHIKFAINDYTVSKYISEVVSSTTMDIIGRALAVAVIATILFICITVLTTKNKDIK